MASPNDSSSGSTQLEQFIRQACKQFIKAREACRGRLFLHFSPFPSHTLPINHHQFNVISIVKIIIINKRVIHLRNPRVKKMGKLICVLVVMMMKVVVVVKMVVVVVCIFPIELNGTMLWISLAMAKLSGS